MNIHEYQAKKILKEFGAPVSNGVVISNEEIKNKISSLKSSLFVLKAQIHSGGRGKAGGVKLIKDMSELEIEANKMMEKNLLLIKLVLKEKQSLYILKKHLKL